MAYKYSVKRCVFNDPSKFFITVPLIVVDLGTIMYKECTGSKMSRKWSGKKQGERSSKLRSNKNKRSNRYMQSLRHYRVERLPGEKNNTTSCFGERLNST